MMLPLNFSTTNSSGGPNCTNSGIFINFPHEWEIAKWIRCTEFVFTIVLNLTLIVLLQLNGKKSNLVFFVFHLVISDLAVATFHIFPLLVNHFVIEWSLGLFLCKLKFYTSNVSLYASTYLIVSIAIDRLLCVLKPLGLVRKRRRYKLFMIAVPWTLSVLLNIPVLGWTTIFSKYGINICTPDLRQVREVSVALNVTSCFEFAFQIALLVNATFLLFIPSIVLIVCYSTIVLFLCKRLQFKGHMALANIGILNKKSRHVSPNSLFSKANRRSTVMTFVVSLTFIVCWMPFILAGLLNLYGNLGNGGWFDILIALAPLNSIVNPIIFLTFNNRTLISRSRASMRRSERFKLVNFT